MPVTRLHAVTNEQLILTIKFMEDNTNVLFDPYSIEQVDILHADGITIIETIPSSSIVRINTGEYQITTGIISQAGLIQDRWMYRLTDGDTIRTTTKTTNVLQAAQSVSIESQDALPRNSAVILRPILLTIEIRDDKTGELIDPYEVRQVEILEEDGSTVIETITSITRIGTGKYRVQASAIQSVKTILDRWYFTIAQNDPESTHTQDTQVYDQSILGDVVPTTNVPESLIADISSTDAELVLIDSVERIGVTYKDNTQQPINPSKLSLEITQFNGTQILSDTYLPLTDRTPDPPRIINPTLGRFEFPLGLDNGDPDTTKTNRTNTRCDLIFIWRANAVAGVKASLLTSGVNLNSSIQWEANAIGTPGNFISIEYIDPGIPNNPLLLDRSGSILKIYLETNAVSTIITTANDIVNAVSSNTQFSEIVTAYIPNSQTGLGVVDPLSQTQLSGGIDPSEEIITYQNVRIITHRILSLLQKLRLQIDKALKLVDTNPESPCYLGYTDGQLLTYLEGGIQTINAYQPSGYFSFENYPYQAYEFTLIEAALLVGVMSQQLFAVDTDIPSWNDQGNAFVIQHQPQLAQYLNFLSQRLDKMIPQLKLNFVSSGSLHIEAGPNYRLTQLLQAAPSGALFRNVFFRG